MAKGWRPKVCQPGFSSRHSAAHDVTRLSVLDQSPIRSGVTAADAVHETLELACLDELGRLYDIDEFVVVTICDRLEARLCSYELLAEVFELQSREA